MKITFLIGKHSTCTSKTSSGTNNPFLSPSVKRTINRCLLNWIWSKTTVIVKEQWIHHKGKDTIIQLKREDIDFLAINSNRFLPEKNRLNNWKYLKSSTGFKPLKFTFYGDSENLKRNQIFYHPISDFNVYDGFTGGMRIYNTRVKNQPFELDLHPTVLVQGK